MSSKQNMNFEDDYIEPLTFEEDKKHDVTKRALKTLEKVMIAQDDYGFKKYGEPLKFTQNYDWIQMFLEEMADGLKYLQNEMDTKKVVINILEFGLNQDNPKYSIKHALSILKKEGTGK